MKLSVVGLDSSHTIEFTRRLQAPDCTEKQKVAGARVERCLRFSTPFQSEEGLDQRQRQMEEWGVLVTTDIDQAIAGADAIVICINDPSRHLEYFEKCAGLGKPIFVDKPLADTTRSAKAICELARAKAVRFFSCSSLRFALGLDEALKAMPQPLIVSTYGALGTAAAGSSIVWYGVHAFEMLERAAGRGAESVRTVTDQTGAVAVVSYPEGRRGVVELCGGFYTYGGCLRSKDATLPFAVDNSMLYTIQLAEIVRFFAGGEPPVAPEDALEVTAMLDAAERSAGSGDWEPIRIN